MPKKIIAVTGLIGSGKNELADYIAKKYGFFVFDYADTLRDMLKEKGIEPTRENLQNYRVSHGNAFLANTVVKKIERSNHDKILLTPIRRPEDYEIPKKVFGANIVMVLVAADEKTRFQRLKKRGSPRDPTTLEEFRRQDKREIEIFNFEKTFTYATHTIENNGTLEDMQKKTDAVMRKIL